MLQIFQPVSHISSQHLEEKYTTCWIVLACKVKAVLKTVVRQASLLQHQLLDHHDQNGVYSEYGQIEPVEQNQTKISVWFDVPLQFRLFKDRKMNLLVTGLTSMDPRIQSKIN